MQKPNPADRRQFGRRQTSLHGWISVPGRPKLACHVKDLSIGGALLGLQAPSWLPFNFVLTIEATRFVSWCEVRHHKHDAVGVRFMSAVESASLDPRGASVNGILEQFLHDTRGALNDLACGDLVDDGRR